jgi:hypothetical protein
MPSLRAWSALYWGLQMFGGRLPSSRAKRMPCANAAAWPSAAAAPVGAENASAPNSGVRDFSRGLNVAG